MVTKNEKTAVDFPRLRVLMNDRGVSAAFLGALAGTNNRHYLGDRERTSGLVPTAVVEKWAEHLGTTVEYLTGKTDDPAIPAAVKTEAEVRVALFGGENVSDDDWAEVLRFVDYIKERRKK